MTLLGHLALWLASVLSLWGAAAGVLGLMRRRDDLVCSARRAARATAAALLTADLALAVAVLRNDFAVAYVAAHSSRTLPALYRWAVLYAGPEGALLLLATALSVCSALAHGRESGAVADRVRAGGGALVAGAVAMLAGAGLFALNPFAWLPFTPPEGLGLDPRLQTPAGMLSPVMLSAACAALTIPFARTLVALAAGRLEFVAIRRWALASWLLLSLGLLLGMRAAYLAPPAPGAWIWDPVSRTGLFAWALLTAVLHAAPIHERRGRLRWWDVALLNGCWLLLVAAVFRAIAVNGATPRGAWVAVMVVSGVASLGLCLWRWPLLTGAGDRAPSHDQGRRSRWLSGAGAAHAGAALLGAALAAAALLQTEIQVVLRPGESATLDSPLGGRYSVTYYGASRYGRENQFVTAATVELARAGRRVAVLRAERLQYEDVFRRPTYGPTARAGVVSRPREDVRVVLRGLSRRTEEAAFRLAVIPLAWWVWAAGCVLILGGLVAAGTSFFDRSRRARDGRTG